MNGKSGDNSLLDQRPYQFGLKSLESKARTQTRAAHRTVLRLRPYVRRVKTGVPHPVSVPYTNIP
jgi:hypothetical protein